MMNSKNRCTQVFAIAALEKLQAFADSDSDHDDGCSEGDNSMNCDADDMLGNYSSSDNNLVTEDNVSIDPNSSSASDPDEPGPSNYIPHTQAEGGNGQGLPRGQRRRGQGRGHRSRRVRMQNADHYQPVSNTERDCTVAEYCSGF